ncbi:MAG TPA: MbcA/ParS/Xre antitoxin family protein [Casimicrobiaceae bacterium]|nr:MbcA/ParS/Xre antitoxin family protein [Casimicrobiaceae bacterium]
MKTAAPVSAREARPIAVGNWSAAGLSGPALRTFFRIADAWKLTVDEARRILGDPPRSTFFLWKRTGEGQLSRDTLERVSYILGIYKALQILLPEADAADAWIRKSNSAPLFGGRSALDRMLSGNVADLYVVRQYLDAARGGWS